MSITTKSGDKGKTSLFGGVRVSKNHIRVECNGEIDELNVRIGSIRILLPKSHEWDVKLSKIQRDLMSLMSNVATLSASKKLNKKVIPEDGLTENEEWISLLEEELKEYLRAFTLPAGTPIAIACHLARTQTRKCERLIVRANEQEPLPEFIIKYFNRLSDLFYMLSIKDLVSNNVNPEEFAKFH